MVHALGVHLLPASGEFVYDTLPYSGAQRVAAGLGPYSNMNTFGGGFPTTDYSLSIDQLQAEHPECGTVSLVCAWFFNSEDASSCNIYPSTNYLLGAFQVDVGGALVADDWRVSSLTQADYPGIIPLPALPGTTNFVYGGTPSDQSIVRCIRDLKSRGLRVIFYPFLLGTGSGFPWRGRITFSPDVSSAATSAVDAFLGAAAPSDFTPDPVNLTVAYSGSPFDWTYRRMILHYAWLCTVAGGVNLFSIGSELRGLETIRGPGWTKAGTTDGSGYAIWDYPFVAGLKTLADDVRGIFDGQGLTKNLSTLENLIAYSADWSSWMGWQHPGENGQWPHLDQLWAHSNIDYVGVRQLPAADRLDDRKRRDRRDGELAQPRAVRLMAAVAGDDERPRPVRRPEHLRHAYLKGNIEGGQYFNWFYNDGDNHGRGFDPERLGPDRVAAGRRPARAVAQPLLSGPANPRATSSCAGGGTIRTPPSTTPAPDGRRRGRKPNGRRIRNRSCCSNTASRRSTRRPISRTSSSTRSRPRARRRSGRSGTRRRRLATLPRRDDTIQALALQAIYEYWNVDGNNATIGGVVMVQFAFSCVWNWDARPFPTFPALTSAWGDTGNWNAGDWSNGLRQALPPVAPTAAADARDLSDLPGDRDARMVGSRQAQVLDHARRACLGPVEPRTALRERHLRHRTDLRGSRASDALNHELQTIAGFFAQMSGADDAVLVCAARPFDRHRAGARNRRRRDHDLSARRRPRRLQRAGEGDVRRLGGLSQRRAQVGGWTVSAGYAPASPSRPRPAPASRFRPTSALLWLCRFADDVQDFEEFMAMLLDALRRCG